MVLPALLAAAGLQGLHRDMPELHPDDGMDLVAEDRAIDVDGVALKDAHVLQLFHPVPDGLPGEEDPRAQFLHGDARVLPEFFDDPHIRCIYLGLHTASALPRHLPG